jgi:hypothetical protein
MAQATDDFVEDGRDEHIEFYIVSLSFDLEVYGDLQNLSEEDLSAIFHLVHCGRSPL